MPTPRKLALLLLLLLIAAAPLPVRADDPAPATATEEDCDCCMVDGPSLLAQPVADYKGRRKALMEAIKAETPHAVVILRGSDSPELEGKFRQTNNFAYLTGVDVPSGYLVLLPDEGTETLYLPPRRGFRSLEAEAMGPGPEAEKALGIDHVVSTAKLLGDLFTAIADPQVRSMRGDATTVLTEDPEPKVVTTTPQARLIRLLHDGAPNTRFADLAPKLAAMRKAKSPAEMVILKRAIAITGDAQDQVLRTIRPGVPEYVLEGKIQGAFVGGGAMRAGFPSIVGSGPNSTIPHYFANDRTLEEGDLVVVDIGAEYKYYTADITRTYPASGKFTERQRAIYQLVLDAQKAVEKEMKPGETKLSDMTRFTRDFLNQSPLRAKDSQGNERPMGTFFIHGLGHYLGMDVHDVGSYAEPVQIGEVFTIEPGIYIPSENIGVRIEDDYEMTADGPKKLSAAILSDPDEIEDRIAEYRGTTSETNSKTVAAER